MLDAVSDVLDWLAAIPWDAVGIGGAVVAAVAASLHFGQVILTGWQRGKRREKLGEFLFEGQGLEQQCADETKPPPKEEAQDWLERTDAYLAKNLGSDYVASFHNAAGLPTGFTTILSMEHSDIASGIRFRLARLQQFLEELRR